MTALSAVLLFLSFLPLPTPHLVWVALVPWLLLVERGVVRGGAATRSARSGAVFFGLFWSLHLYWVILLVPRLGVVWPLWAYLSQVLMMSILGALVAGGIHALRVRARLPLPLAAALAWAGVEWGRGHLLGPLAFPWSPVALPLADSLPFLQPAAWLGESGLGAGVVAVNGLVALAWAGGDGPRRVRRAPRRWGPLAATGVTLVFWWALGEARIRRLAPVPVVRVGVVQPSISLAAKRDPEMALSQARESVGRLLPALDGSSVQVVVVPETHYPVEFAVGGVGGGRAVETAEELAGWARALGAEILTGGYTPVPGGTGNALVRFTADGPMEAYGKVALVPGVEWVPGGQMGRGPGVQPMNAPGRAGPLICIESAWSSLARRQAREGAGWLVNVTNDAWLGESATWTRTPAFRQHPRHLAFRSVETGLGALRAANNGLTGVVHPSGRWELLLPPHRAGVAVTTVESLPSATPFAMTGDLAGPLSLLALLAALSLVAVGRRSPVDHDDPGL